MFPDTGGNSNNIPATNMTLESLNAAEVRRLVPTIVYMTVLSVAGMLGNGIVCHVYRTRYRLSNTQCFILCLSAIDLLSCAIGIPLDIATVINQYKFEHLWLCKFSRFLNTLNTLSSSFLLLFIATDRYRKVCRPFDWQITANVTKFLCVFSVILGLLFSWPAIFIYGKQRFEISKYNLTGTECSTDESMIDTSFPLIRTAVFGVLFIGAIIFICILYCFIGREIQNHAKKMQKDLSVQNKSAPMFSSTVDANSSIVSAELDPEEDNKYNAIATKRKLYSRKSSKQKARQSTSDSSWMNRKEFSVSCSIDDHVNDVSVVGTTERNWTEDTQPDNICINSAQANQYDNEKTIRNASTGNNDHTISSNKTQEDVVVQRHVEICNEISTESPSVVYCLGTIKNHNTDAKNKEDMINDTTTE